MALKSFWIWNLNELTLNFIEKLFIKYYNRIVIFFFFLFHFLLYLMHTLSSTKTLSNFSKLNIFLIVTTFLENRKK